MLSRKQAPLFLKKKARPPAKQKDFFESGPAALAAPGSSIKKVFAPLFSKSGCLLSFAGLP
jgi:hypothetical protein